MQWMNDGERRKGKGKGTGHKSRSRPGAASGRGRLPVRPDTAGQRLARTHACLTPATEHACDTSPWTLATCDPIFCFVSPSRRPRSRRDRESEKGRPARISACMDHLQLQASPARSRSIAPKPPRASRKASMHCCLRQCGRSYPDAIDQVSVFPSGRRCGVLASGGPASPETDDGVPSSRPPAHALPRVRAVRASEPPRQTWRWRGGAPRFPVSIAARASCLQLPYASCRPGRNYAPAPHVRPSARARCERAGQGLHCFSCIAIMQAHGHGYGTTRSHMRATGRDGWSRNRVRRCSHATGLCEEGAR